MIKLFITATNTDIGKTYTTKLLMKHLTKLGHRVGVLKPVETGVVDGVFLDGQELLELLHVVNKDTKKFCVKDVVPISFSLPSAPYIASGGKTIEFEKIENSIKKFEDVCDVLLIEGAGGLYVPIEKDFMMIDLIKKLHVDKTLLVTHCSLGCINDTLLSKNVLKDLPHIVVFNCKDGDESFKQVSQKYFEDVGFEVLKLSEDIDTICELLV